MRKFRYLNGVAIAYIIVTLLTVAVLIGIDKKLPEAFFIAITSADFWHRYGGGAAVFAGVVFVLMFILYIYAGRAEAQSKRIVSGFIAALFCASFYGTTLFVLLLSGLRH